MNLEVRWLNALDQVEANTWDSLHDGNNPFLTHAFLSGLEQHGCLRPSWGWQPLHLTLWDNNTLVAAAPGYLKHNSHGEFVFDHAWANAYALQGQAYYPKWLCGIPYCPVTGPRLLARDTEKRQALLTAIQNRVTQDHLSSAHINFHTADEEATFGHADNDWLTRNDVQYHWCNMADWPDFDTFLGTMDHKHRKNIRQERAKVARTGVQVHAIHGDEAMPMELEAMHRFYLSTFHQYGNTPALTLQFLKHLAKTIPRQLVLFMARLEGKLIGGSLCLRGGKTLYGRHWGGAALPGLHFETCYYQGIDYCLREGLTRFEPGAQGTHKIARGFLPAKVRSRHWISDPHFRAPLAHWCTKERIAVTRYMHKLVAHSPFRKN
ncbi:MAG TPA: GNAT family N-acetyltransferase [Xylella sp.]